MGMFTRKVFDRSYFAVQLLSHPRPPWRIPSPGVLPRWGVLISILCSFSVRRVRRGAGALPVLLRCGSV